MADEGSEGNEGQQKDSGMPLEAKQSGHGDAIVQNSRLLDKLPLELLARILWFDLMDHDLSDDVRITTTEETKDRKTLLKLVCQRFHDAARSFGSDVPRIFSLPDLERLKLAVQSGKTNLAVKIRGLMIDLRGHSSTPPFADASVASIVDSCVNLEQLVYRHDRFVNTAAQPQILSMGKSPVSAALQSRDQLLSVCMPDRIVHSTELGAFCRMPRLSYLRTGHLVEILRLSAWKSSPEAQRWEVNVAKVPARSVMPDDWLARATFDDIMVTLPGRIMRLYFGPASATGLAATGTRFPLIVALDISIRYVGIKDVKGGFDSMPVLDELVLRDLVWLDLPTLTLLLARRLARLKIGGRTSVHNEMHLGYDTLVESLASLSDLGFGARHTTLVIATQHPITPSTGQAPNPYQVSNWQPNQRRQAQEAANFVGIDLYFDCGNPVCRISAKNRSGPQN